MTQSGPLGQILQTTIAYETADWSSIDPEFCSAARLSKAYVQAVQSADTLMNEIDAVGA